MGIGLSVVVNLFVLSNFREARHFLQAAYIAR
jgi:hypothetical protein